MNFEDYYQDVYFDGFIREWEYLVSGVYYNPFERSQMIWREGSGRSMGYCDTAAMIWDESLIFKL